jgi:hypothetical protein
LDHSSGIGPKVEIHRFLKFSLFSLCKIHAIDRAYAGP